MLVPRRVYGIYIMNLCIWRILMSHSLWYDWSKWNFTGQILEDRWFLSKVSADLHESVRLLAQNVVGNSSIGSRSCIFCWSQFDTLLKTTIYPLPVGTCELLIFLFPFGGICGRSLEGKKKVPSWKLLSKIMVKFPYTHYQIWALGVSVKRRFFKLTQNKIPA